MKKALAVLISITVVLSLVFQVSAISSIPVTGISLKTTVLSLKTGETAKIGVAFTPVNTTQKLLVFTTSDKNVATIDKAGNVKAVKAGSAVITVASASNGKIAAKCQVFVWGGKSSLKIFINPDATITDIKTNELTKWLEDKTGIHIDWVVSGQNEAKDKLNIMLAAGSKLPDVIMTANAAQIITDDQIFNLGEQKVFIPLNSMIDTYGENVKKAFEDFSGSRAQMTAPDGNIYALPRMMEAYHTTLPEKYWINQSWLNKLNLKMPTTPDELYTVLKAFKDMDPNGNGKKDEIPLSGRTNQYSTMDSFIMNAFQYSPGSNGDNFYWLYVRFGKVMFAPTQTGWKTGLKYERRLYQDDLMDSEIFINTKPQLLALTGDPNGNRVGSFQCLHIGGGVDTNSSRAADYSPVPPLKGPLGQVAPNQPLKYYPAYMITKDCKQPELAFKLGSFLMTNPLADPDTMEWMNMLYGPEGQGWERAKADEKGLDGQPAIYKDLVSGKTTQNIWWVNAGPCVFPDSLRNRMVADISKWSNEKSLYDATKNVYEPYRMNMTLPYMNYTTADASELAEIRVNIQKYVNESMAKFVTGAMDLDRDWDKYVAQLNAMGLQKMLDITQKTYDKYYGKK
jgi:putative aldouronate transport system substrate-binding protein